MTILDGDLFAWLQGSQYDRCEADDRRIRAQLLAEAEGSPFAPYQADPWMSDSAPGEPAL